MYNYGIYGEASGNFAQAGFFNGDVWRTGNDNFSSDRKLKSDIKPLVNSLTKIMKLKPSTYMFKTEEFKEMHLPKGPQMGLIAQELEEVFPELVTTAPEVVMDDGKGGSRLIHPEYKAVQYISLIPVLINAIQEQQKQISEKQTQDQLMQDKIAGLEKHLEDQNQLIEELSKSSANSVGVQINNDQIPGFEMGQNEPNPFTHETTVHYNIPRIVNNASMIIYDLSGLQIKSIAISEAGAGSLTITSENLKAGMYIYSIVVDGKILDTKRMVVAEK